MLVVVVIVVVVVVVVGCGGGGGGGGGVSGGNCQMDEVGMTLLAQARLLLCRKNYLR